MKRKQFIRLLGGITAMSTLGSFKNFTDTLPLQSKRMPVLFTSHGSPLDIPVPRDERPFWNSLFELGKKLQNEFEVKAVLVLSAHWCTEGTFVNISPEQTQIYDYVGFPDHYYQLKYHAKGAPEIARIIKKIIPFINETPDWGLDHGAWPMLMHLIPNADIPVFQMSINYDASPSYHFDLGRQLKVLRNKGVLIIGSGALVHNIPLAIDKARIGDMSPYGWEQDYDQWIKKEIDLRNFDSLLNYKTSHKLAGLAAPTPDHFVPVLYSLGLMDFKDELKYFYETPAVLPAFSERSFIIESH